jgi:hypothetical protein
MPSPTLTPITPTRAGVVFALVAATSGGDSFLNTGVEVLQVTNGSGSSITLTFPIAATVDGQAVASKTVAVAAGATKIIGPFPTSAYNDVNGFCNVTYSGVTTLTVGILKPS